MEIVNRRARHDYFIEKEYECGIALTGTEVKSVRKGSCNIKDSYGVIKNNELFLLNMYIDQYKEGNIFNHEETRTRKLLLHKNEIKKIKQMIDQLGYTIVPLKLYFNDKNKLKVLIGICKGKKEYDKRETLKERDINNRIKKTISKY